MQSLPKITVKASSYVYLITNENRFYSIIKLILLIVKKYNEKQRKQITKRLQHVHPQQLIQFHSNRKKKMKLASVVGILSCRLNTN